MVVHVVELLERSPDPVGRVAHARRVGAQGGRLLQCLETLADQFFVSSIGGVYGLRIGCTRKLGKQAVKEKAAALGSGTHRAKFCEEILHVAFVEAVLAHLPRRSRQLMGFVHDKTAIVGQQRRIPPHAVERIRQQIVMVADLKQRGAALLCFQHTQERTIVGILAFSGTGIGNGYPLLVIFGETWGFAQIHVQPQHIQRVQLLLVAPVGVNALDAPRQPQGADVITLAFAEDSFKGLGYDPFIK